MAKLTTAEFIEAIKELSVLELNELVKACEEEFVNDEFYSFYAYAWTEFSFLNVQSLIL